MSLRDQYRKETGKSPMMYAQSIITDDYVKWLEEKVLEPQLLTWIEKMFKHAEEKQWYETYFLFDIHGTISLPDYRKGIKKIPSEPSRVIYYPYAKETLQLLSKTRPDIIKIIWSSSYPEELKTYIQVFKKDGINFKYTNENPEISETKGHFGFYDKKPYFNVLFEDKCGFMANNDWAHIYNYFVNTKYKPNRNWKSKYKEFYHKT